MHMHINVYVSLRICRCTCLKQICIEALEERYANPRVTKLLLKYIDSKMIVCADKNPSKLIKYSSEFFSASLPLFLTTKMTF